MADGLPDWAEPVAGAQKPLTGLPDWAEPAARQDTPSPSPPAPTAIDNLNRGLLTTPEEAAKALKLGPQVGVPAATVALDPKAHQQEADQREAIRAVETNPNIRAYVQKSALNAAVSRGDYPALQRASDSMSELEPERVGDASFGRMLLESMKVIPSGRAMLGIGEAARLTARGMLVGIGRPLKGLVESVETPAEAEASSIHRIGSAFTDLGMKVPVSKEEEESVFGQTMTMAGGMAPIIATAFVNPVLGAALGALYMGGGAYNETYEDARKKGASEEDARAAAGWNATIGSILGSLPINAAFAVKGPLAKIAVSDAAFATLGEAQTWATAKIAEEYYDPNSTYSFDAKRLLAELVLGASVGGVHVAVENATAERQKAFVEQTLRKAEKTRAEAAAIMAEAQSEVEHFTLQKAVADLNETKTREMSSEAAEDFAEVHTGLLGNVFVPAYRIDEIYKAEGKVPGRNDGLFGWIPDLANRLEGELDKGSEIKIPIKKYLANMAKTPELHARIADEVRLQESGKTRVEAEEAREAAEAEKAKERGPREVPGATYAGRNAQGNAVYVRPDGRRVVVDESGNFTYETNVFKPSAEGGRVAGEENQFFKVVEGEERPTKARGVAMGPLDRQLSDLREERTRLNTEQVPGSDQMAVHPDNLLLARALDVATDPKATQLGSINAAKWAMENGRQDIAQAIVDRAENRVYQQTRVGAKVGMAELPRQSDAEKVRVHGEERDTTVGEHLRALYAGEDINPLMQRTIDRLVDLVGDVPVRIRHELTDPDAKAQGWIGFYDGDRREIYIRSDADPFVAVHEAVHPATVDALEKRPEVRAGVERMMAAVRHVTAGVHEDPYHPANYAMTNPEEFVAEALSNPRFQRWLRTTEMTPELRQVLGAKGKLETMWEVFKDWVRTSLNLPKGSEALLEHALRASEAAYLDRPAGTGGKRGMDKLGMASEDDKVVVMRRAANENVPLTPKELRRLKSDLTFRELKEFEAELDRKIAERKAREEGKEPPEPPKKLGMAGERKPTQVENELRVLREQTGLEPTPRPARDSLLSEYLTDPLAQEVVAQVVKQRKALYLDPIFAEPPEGVSKPLWEAYAKQLDRQHEAIVTKAVELATKWHRERQTTEWKALSADVRKDVETDIKFDPAYAADLYFNGKTKGVLPNGKKNPDFTPMAETRADVIAPVFGFDSGSAMTKAVLELETQRKDLGITQGEQRERAIQAEVEKRMEERHGKLEDNIALAASEEALAITNFNILSAENRMLAELNGVTPPLTREFLLEGGREQFGKTMVGGVSSEKEARAARRAGEKAELALLKGDTAEAFRQKQMQLQAFAAAKEAKVFEREVVKAQTRFAKLLNERKIKSIDQTHLDQARSMLADVGYTNKHDPIAPLADRAQWVADSEGKMAVADWLTAPPETKLPQVKSDMTVQQFRDLVKSIDSVVNSGKDWQTFKSADQAATRENFYFDLDKSLSRFPTIENRRHPNLAQRIRRLGRYVSAKHILVERVLDYSDGFDPKGVLTQFLDRPLRDAAAHETRLEEATVNELKKLEKYTTSAVNRDIDTRHLPQLGDLTGTDLREIAMLMGSKEGREKFTQKGKFISEADTLKLLRDNMTKDDWLWVKGMHEIWEKLYVEAAAMELRDTGVPMDKRTPARIDTGQGFEIPGGYSPIVHEKGGVVARGVAARKPLFNDTFETALPPHGYTKKLTGAMGPLDITGATIAGKMKTMIHDIAFREALRNAHKIINDPQGRFHDIMSRAWGSEYADLFPGWLKHIANVQNRDDTYSRGLARGLSYIRKNVVSNLTWMNPKTIVKHGITAALMSINRVGVRDMATYGTKFVGPRKVFDDMREMMVRKLPIDQDFAEHVRAVIDPTEEGDNIRQFIMDSSAFLRSRNRNVADTLYGAYARVSKAGPLQTALNIRDQTMTLGRVPLATIDALSVYPTWLSAYKKAMAADPDHTNAVYQADREVARAHGSHFAGDVPAVMMLPNTTAGELMRYFTAFYNFFNHFHNNVVQTAWDIRSRFPDRQTEANATISSISGRLTTIMLVSLVEELTTGWASKEHKGFIWSAVEGLLKTIGGGYMVARELTGALTEGYDISTGLLGTIGKSVVAEGKDVYGAWKRGKLSKNWLPHLAATLGIFTGGPGPAAVEMGEFGVGTMTGAEKPRGTEDVIRGVFTGHARPKEERPR